MQGQLGDKLIADLIRELAEKNSTGLLRLTKGKMIKAIFFQGGSPKFAISNVAKEQLDYKLVKDGLATTEQLDQAKHLAGKANQLGAALVETGVLTDDLMRKVVADQVMGIIMSLFEWELGDYVFDERIRANHEVTLECSAADVLLEGARYAAQSPAIAEAIAPPDGVVIRPRLNGGRADSGKLMPVESYILSRIDSPTAVSEVGSLSGIPEEEAHRAICALVAAGLLKLAGDQKDEEASEKDPDSIDHVREEVARRLHFFATADYYEMLEVTRQSTTADIKMAYYNLAKKFHPDRYHQLSRDSELRGSLESLFARITQAYDTLRHPAQRGAYDEQLRKPAARTTGALNPEPRIVERRVPAEERKAAGADAASGADSFPSQGSSQAGSTSAPANQQGTHDPLPADTHQTSSANPGRTAEYYYQQGRARFDRKEYHAAVHLLREAVRIDPAKPLYHFHLGMALINNPRTRREAEQHLSKAAELDPYNANMRLKLGIIYKEAGLPKKAEHFFKEVLSLDPANRHALRELKEKRAEAGNIWKSDLGSIAKRIFKK